MDFTPILNDDCLLLIFDRVPLQQRLTTLSLVCRRWAKLQPFVRKMVTSMTLLFAAGSSNHLNFESPFQLEEKQNTIITERPDLLRLCFTSSSLTNDNVLKAADLPNIRRLTIVQLMDDLSLATAIILPLIEQLAGQLTSFSFHYKPIYIVKAPLDESVVSVGLQRLLAVVNYQMFRLRHLLLNIDFDWYYQRELMPSFFYCEPDSFDLMGSLYLPVLRRLASFSFHSKCDHIELLHYSLRTFAASNHRLRLRLVLPSKSNGFVHENDPTLWVWDEPVLQSQLEHLVVKKVSKGSCLKALSLPFSSLTSLHLGCLDNDKPETLMFSLFTALSSLPLLTTLQLDLEFFFAKGRHHQNLYSFTPADCTAVLVLVLLVIMPTTSEHAQIGDDYYQHHENDDDHKHHQKYVNNVDN
ncbi:hypothetical protein TYRP_005479 [Tyrophagus putrescentiae]|nr:hypothetical protein TYRP_005479 [Tyrophagus putrescentiae]